MYYLKNFETALHWVGDRYSDLLDASEQGFYSDFSALPLESRALLVRLIMRKGDLFRESKIVYPEIGDTRRASEPLIERGWMDPRPSLTIGELFKLLTRTELAGMFDVLQTGVRKSAALSALQSAGSECRPLDDWRRVRSAGEPDERVFRVTVAPLCARFRILFFGNFRQEWSEFVLADLGVFRYEKIEFSCDSRAFQTRQDIEELYVLYQCREDFYADKAPAEVLAKLPRSRLSNDWLEGRRAKLLFQLAQAFERAGDPDLAAGLYADSSHPGARLRRIRLMELMGRHAAARDLADLAFQRPHGEAERQKLLRIQARLDQRLQGKKAAPARRHVPERLDLTLPPPEPDTGVEFAVLAHLSTPDAPIFYVENALINSLFGLLFWDAIFAAVRGAFYHPFQSGPADLYSAEFQARRQPCFDRGFAALRADAHRDVIRRNFHDKHGIQSPFVFWGPLSETLLELALDCIPALHLRCCFERLLANIDENRSGLPDLIQFWPATRRYRMIEVKGPGDRLQDNQLRWMSFCAQHQIPVAVCHARWSGFIQ